MNQIAGNLLNKIQRREAHVGVVGLGYVGLPLAVELAKVGFRVTGIDLDKRKIQAINSGHSYIPDVPTEELAALTQSGKLDATTDFSIVRKLDTINICVPTPLRKTKDPDMSYIVSAVESIAEHLHPGLLICLESTTYPGTTDELVQPTLEAKGMKVGTDIFLAFSPERVDPGNPTFHTGNVPKVVGGVTEHCQKLATALYGSAIATIVPVSSTRVAEMVKLLENTFRAVNIALVNELALMCDRMGIDVWEVVDAARTKPFGFMAIRRAVFESLGGFAPNLGKRRGTLLGGEDHDLCQRAVTAGYNCEYRPELRVQHWVPAERTRLRYFLRWFFWSGITHAVIEGTTDSTGGPAEQSPTSPLHWLRRLLLGTAAVPLEALSGRASAAAAQAMDAAYALGYLTVRIGGRQNAQRDEGRFSG